MAKPIKYSQLREIVLKVIRGETRDPELERRSMQSSDARMFDAMSRFRILVVEDNVVNQKFALRLLRNRGYRADAVANGLEALEAIDRTRYDAILMDCQMPEMDGFRATAEIRRLEKPGEHIPIIAMTANAMRGDREKCLDAGMDDYISKPVRRAALQDLLDTYLFTKGEPFFAEDRSRTSESSLTTSSPIPPFDPTPLQELCGDDINSLRELIELYITQTNECLADLRLAIEKNAADNVRFLAHSCKGTSANCGMDVMAMTMFELEQLGRSGHLDNARSLHQIAEQHLETIKKYYQSQYS